MSQYRPAERARQQREAAERQMKRKFWTGLLVPAIACTVAALLIGPDSWLGWAAVIAVAPAAAAGVAITFMLQDRRKPTA
jgi:1,4-dihydroxy-2-naphthoate octaprenyltransferase